MLSALELSIGKRETESTYQGRRRYLQRVTEAATYWTAFMQTNHGNEGTERRRPLTEEWWAAGRHVEKDKVNKITTLY